MNNLYIAALLPCLGVQAQLDPPLKALAIEPALFEPLGCPFHAGSDLKYSIDELDCITKWLMDARHYIQEGGKPTTHTNNASADMYRKKGLERLKELSQWYAQYRLDAPDTPFERQARKRYSDSAKAPKGAAPEPGQLVFKEKKDVKDSVKTVGEDSDGKTVLLQVGRTLEVRLAGNPTTGYNWEVDKLDGDAVEQAGPVDYRQEPAQPNSVGAGGIFSVTLRGAKPGKAVFRMQYRRSWEKDPPSKVFTVTVKVSDPAKKAKH